MPYTLKDPVRHKFTKKSYNVRDWRCCIKENGNYQRLNEYDYQQLYEIKNLKMCKIIQE